MKHKWEATNPKVGKITCQILYIYIYIFFSQFCCLSFFIASFSNFPFLMDLTYLNLSVWCAQIGRSEVDGDGFGLKTVGFTVKIGISEQKSHGCMAWGGGFHGYEHWGLFQRRCMWEGVPPASLGCGARNLTLVAEQKTVRCLFIYFIIKKIFFFCLYAIIKIIILVGSNQLNW